MTESVVVSAEPPALNLEKGEISAVVTERKIVDLPLNGRNVYQLAELQPGIVRTAGSGLQESETTDAQFGASGKRFRDNQILLDGVTNNNDRQGGRTTLTLSPDAVEQFRVVTNNLSAEFGRSGGGLISVITRGGTNTPPHGSAFWFHRNDNLDAATTFEARSMGKNEFKRNHFGGTLGGPVIKDHTFFFFSYQGLRQIRPSLVNSTVETPQFRDFVQRTRPNSLAAQLLKDFPPQLNPTSNIRDIGSPAPGVQSSMPRRMAFLTLAMYSFQYLVLFTMINSQCGWTTRLTVARTPSPDGTASTTARNSAPATTAPAPFESTFWRKTPTSL